MTAAAKNSPADWLNAFLPIGTQRDDAWVPVGAGVLVLDMPVVWLITAAPVIDQLAGERTFTWVPRQRRAALLDLSRTHEQLGLSWVRHHKQPLAATLLPVDPSFDIKAFSVSQCTRLRDLQPLQPAVAVGCLYGHDIKNPGYPAPAVLDGVVSRVEPGAGIAYTTAPLLPRNTGAPLLLASPYGGPVTLAGILVANVLITDVDPRVMPVRLSTAVGVDAVFELIHGEEAKALRQRATRSERTTEAPASTGEGP